jgi:hypothetical protein
MGEPQPDGAGATRCSSCSASPLAACSAASSARLSPCRSWPPSAAPSASCESVTPTAREGGPPHASPQLSPDAHKPAATAVVERGGSQRGKRTAEDSARDRIDGIVHPCVYARVGYERGHRVQWRARRGKRTADAGGERERRGRMSGRKRGRAGHVNVPSDRYAVQCAIRPAATPERLERQVDHAGGDGDGRQPAHGGPASTGAAGRSQKARRSEPQLRVVGGSRERRETAVERRRRARRDRCVHRYVERFQLTSPGGRADVCGSRAGAARPRLGAGARLRGRHSGAMLPARGRQ